MTGRYGIDGIRRHRLEIDAAKHDDEARRLFAACRGELRARIGDVVHGHDGHVGLPRTACGVRWVPGVSSSFPRGASTDDEVDCMSCLVRMERP